MNHLILLSLLLLSVFCYVQAQSSSGQSDTASQDAVTNFQPSLAVVIGILAVMFSLTFILLVYAKFCHRVASVHHNQQSLDGLIRSGSRFSGIDKTVIESLPFFRFSSLRGSKEGLECAVCLSKFEDVEVLRLLPKCKHAFHIDCVDQWLEKHSSCPLCRHKISADDLVMMTYSNSLRFLSGQGEEREDSNVELFVQREESHHGSSRFSVGSSFRKLEKGVKEEELPIQENCDHGIGESENGNGNEGFFHKFNHRIIVSDVVLKTRWSNLSSSDLMFLNSEMLGEMTSKRFSSLESNAQESSITREIEEGGIMNIKEEMERKRDFETKVSRLNPNDISFPLSSSGGGGGGGASSNPIHGFRVLDPNEKRSMSEITVQTRFKEFKFGNNSIGESSSVPENAAKEERLKRLWLPIARRTVQWSANREERSNNTRQSLNV